MESPIICFDSTTKSVHLVSLCRRNTAESQGQRPSPFPLREATSPSPPPSRQREEGRGEGERMVWLRVVVYHRGFLWGWGGSFNTFVRPLCRSSEGLDVIEERLRDQRLSALLPFLPA